MFGDRPFFGESAFQTPPPPPPPPPKPDYGGEYKYGANQSGFKHGDGSFTGYQSDPNQPLGYFDRSNHVHG